MTFKPQQVGEFTVEIHVGECSACSPREDGLHPSAYTHVELEVLRDGKRVTPLQVPQLGQFYTYWFDDLGPIDYARFVPIAHVAEIVTALKRACSKPTSG